MATSSFFYGGSSAPDQNTVDELIDALNAKVAAADEDRVAAELAASQALASANNAELAESNTAGLAAQAQTTLTAAEAAVASANAAVAGTAANASTATTQAGNAAASAAAALASETAAAASAATASTQAGNASTSASTATAQASAASTSASNAASSASAAAGSASTATTQAGNASTSASNAASSASAASTSASNAASSASAASSSATAASGSASAASGSASAAAGSASTASSAATAAQAAQTAAEAAYDNFDDRYLGAKSSAPSVDNDGNALVTGALYFNSTLGQMAAWNGSSWGAIGSNPDSVLGPASSTDNAIARFDGTTGKLVQNSTTTISDEGNISVAPTWNNAGTTFTGLKVDITDTASNAGSLLADLQIGGNSKFKVNKLGGIYAGRAFMTSEIPSWGSQGVAAIGYDGSISAVIGAPSGISQVTTLGAFSFSNLANNGYADADAFLYRDAAQTIAQRNGTNPQTFRLYNTYTDASNYERGVMRWNTNALQIGTEKAGTGQTRNIEFVYGGSVVGSIYNLYGNIFEFSGTLAPSRIVASGPGSFTILGYQAAAGLNGVFTGSTDLVGWGSTANPNNGVDTAIARDSAGVIKLTDGSTGTGSLKAANIDFTGNLTKNGTPFSGGAKGGGSDAVFYENDQSVTTNYTIGTNKNAMSAGPVSVNAGVTVTVPSGSRWVIV